MNRARSLRAVRWPESLRITSLFRIQIADSCFRKTLYKNQFFLVDSLLIAGYKPPFVWLIGHVSAGKQET